MNPVYPDLLPVGLQNSRAYQLVNPMQRSTMVSGQARQRRAFTDVPQGATIQWLFNDVQARAFEAWWRDTLVDGSLWFECPLRTPLGYLRLTCRFTGVYAGPVRVGTLLWSYSGELELRERAVPPVGTGEFPDYILMADIFDRAVNQYWPDHNWQTYMSAGDNALNQQWPSA